VNTRLIFVLAIASGVLQACTAPDTEWSNVEAPREVRVDYDRLTHATGFAPGTAAVSRIEQADLAQFLRAAEVRSGDPIYLEAAASDRLAARRIGSLARQLTHQGYEVASLPPSRDAVPANHLLVVVERYVVTPPACPNFTKSPGSDHENAVSSNFGCATQTNLSLMVANPRDLVIGRDPGLAPGDPAVLPIQRFRVGKTAPLPTENAGEAYAAQQTPTGGTSAAPVQGTGQ